MAYWASGLMCLPKIQAECTMVSAIVSTGTLLRQANLHLDTQWRGTALMQREAAKLTGLGSARPRPVGASWLLTGQRTGRYPLCGEDAHHEFTIPQKIHFSMGLLARRADRSDICHCGNIRVLGPSAPYTFPSW